MSCTVVALPYALFWVIGAIATAAAETATNITPEQTSFRHEFINELNIEDNCTEDVTITEKHFIEKTFETPFASREILLKTLQEHGVKNITEWENTVSGEVENYKLTFEKVDENKPYTVRISCLENESAEDKIKDINSEYTLNVQEDTYLHILDKLKENNMEVENEEVMDDNTIVLTVNIE